MKRFDVQSIDIAVARGRAFGFIADPEGLPRWAEAFESVSARVAVMRTPQGRVEVGLETLASPDQGTIDWRITFPDGSVARAYSRVVELDPGRCAYTFVLMAPPVPLQDLEGALEVQSKTLARELVTLKGILEARGA